jgi:hypothetical protein
MLSKDALDGGRRDPVPFGDLTDTLALASIPLDCWIIQYKWIAADVLAFEAGASHAGAHPLDDQVALKLSDGADDDDDSPAERAGGIDVFSEADVLDVEPAELVKYIEEVLDRPGKPVRSPLCPERGPQASGQ